MPQVRRLALRAVGARLEGEGPGVGERSVFSEREARSDVALGKGLLAFLGHLARKGAREAKNVLDKGAQHERREMPRNSRVGSGRCVS